MKAKKSLGQNFLNSAEVVGDILRAGEVTEHDIVLEVGPGEGVLTAELLKVAAKVVAVEKDDRMIPVLSERFKKESAAGKLELIHGDILEFKPQDFFAEKSYKLIANIPYYITGELFRMFFETTHSPGRIVVMVQKEVAERIVAKDGKESILSISVKAYGRPFYIKTVPAAYFTPAPNVDSAILLVESISKDFFAAANTQNAEKTEKSKNVSEKRFFEVIKAGFAHKRKLLIRNLETIAPQEILEKAFTELSFDRNVRAEEMTTDAWRQLVILLS